MQAGEVAQWAGRVVRRKPHALLRSQLCKAQHRGDATAVLHVGHDHVIDLGGEKLFEIGDVYAMINLLVEHDVVSWTELEDRVDYKKNKLKKWSDLI